MNPYDPVASSCDEGWARISLLVQRRVPASSPIVLNCSENVAPESDSTAQRKLTDWGFDPNDVSKSSNNWYNSNLRVSSNIDYRSRASRPMIIFAHLGDLPMLKYILLQSSDPVSELTQSDECGLFPLYAAISKPHTQDHILTLCRWFVSNGADIQQRVGGEWSPLSRAILFGYDRVAQWFLSQGALLDEAGAFDSNLAKADIPPTYEGANTLLIPQQVHLKLFAWARRICFNELCYKVFLMGTRSTERDLSTPRHRVEQYLVRQAHYSPAAASFLLQDMSDAKLREFLSMTASPLSVFDGHGAVLKLVGQYLGVERNAKIFSTAQGLVEHETWWISQRDKNEMCVFISSS